MSNLEMIKIKDLCEKIWIRPICWKSDGEEEKRLMGKIKPEFNLDQYFSAKDE